MDVPPGPRGRQVFGFFNAPIAFLERTARQYGPVSSFRVLNRRIYLVDDAELIKDVLVTRQHSFERDSGAKLLRELVGDGLITREEPLHKERRRMLQPAFHNAQIAGYARIMASASQRLAASWRDGQELDIRSEMRELTLAIVGASLFGADFRESAEQVANILLRIGKRSRWLAPAFVFLEPLFTAYRRMNPNGRSIFYQERQELDRILRPVLESQRGRSADGRSVINLLAGEEGILDELVTFMLAGHETTATALTWTWYLLARNPAVEAALHEELDRAPDEPTLENLAQFPYTSKVFQEALRLYPPAMAFARRTKEALELGGFRIPRGTSVFLSPYVTQRNPRYFEDPLAFRPERWDGYNGPKFSYFPFGGGAKMCIGDSFARLEGVIALAAIARRWKLATVDNEAAEIGPGFLLRPEKTIRMKAFAITAVAGGKGIH